MVFGIVDLGSAAFQYIELNEALASGGEYAMNHSSDTSGIQAAIKAALEKKELPALEPGAMSYMLSHQQYLGDAGKAWKPHLMFHIPTTNAAAWGANQPGSPVMLDTSTHEVPEPQTVFMIAAPAYSDGTPAPGAPAHGHAD